MTEREQAAADEQDRLKYNADMLARAEAERRADRRFARLFIGLVIAAYVLGGYAVYWCLRWYILRGTK